MGDEYPRLNGSDGFLPVLRQSAASSEPCEGSLNDPAHWQNLEAPGGIGPLDDLDRPVAEAAHGSLEFRPGIAAVREDVSQPGPAGPDGAQDRWRSVAILNAGRVNHEPDQQAERVGDDVPLATLDPLAGVEATNPAALGGFCALTIDDAGARARLAALQPTRRHDQVIADRPPQAAVAPFVEIALHRRGGREVLREHAPLATGRRDVEDRAHHLPQVRRPGAADPTRRRQERRDQRPFPIRQIACIARPSADIVAPSGIIPEYRVSVSLRKPT